MTQYQLHQDGDCGTYCPVCEHEDEQERELTIAELIEVGTGLNGQTTIDRLAAVGLEVVKTE